MVVLIIANMTNDNSIGPNINVPKNVIYGNNYATVGLYNPNDIEIINMNGYVEKYFKGNDMKNYDVATLPAPFNKPDIVVFNSLYIIEHVKIAKKLKNLGIPYIIIPRGALTKKAQHKKWYKKIPANIVIFNKYVSNALLIQFLTQNEYNESKHFKFNDYIIVGNGCDKKNNIKKYSSTNREFKIVFIGRIEKFHKGLDVLVEAINYGQKELRNNNIKIYLYGPDRRNSIKFLNKRINKYKIEDLVEIKTPVFEKEKEKVLLESDVFIHTSRLEGHPTAIIDAISYGIPVIVTPGTNMTEVVKEFKLGFCADFSKKDIYETIINAYNNRNTFEQISSNEIKYADKELSWNEVMKKNIKYYEKKVKNKDTLILKLNKNEMFFKDKENIENYYWCNPTNIMLRAFKKLNFPLTFMFYGKWKKQLNDYKTVILFDTGYYNNIPNYIKRKNKNIKIIYWYWNGLKQHRNILVNNKYIDEIWTYDRYDAEKYGLKYNPQFYSCINDTSAIKQDSEKNDVVFVGRDKGRRTQIQDVEKILVNCGLNCKFKIVSNSKDFISYEEYIDEVRQAKCILDFNYVLPGGLTLRPLEALFMNKKLITNNIDVINYKFYNPKNIFIIGKDNWNDVKEFCDSPYQEVDENIIKYYDFDSWLSRFGKDFN